MSDYQRSPTSRCMGCCLSSGIAKRRNGGSHEKRTPPRRPHPASRSFRSLVRRNMSWSPRPVLSKRCASSANTPAMNTLISRARWRAEDICGHERSVTSAGRGMEPLRWCELIAICDEWNTECCGTETCSELAADCDQFVAANLAEVSRSANSAGPRSRLRSSCQSGCTSRVGIPGCSRSALDPDRTTRRRFPRSSLFEAFWREARTRAITRIENEGKCLRLHWPRLE